MEIGTPNDNPFPGAVTMKYEGYCTSIFPLEIWHFIHLLYFSMIKLAHLKKYEATTTNLYPSLFPV